MRRVLTSIASLLLVAGAAAAETPTFSELFDDDPRRNNLPVSFPADLGMIFVSADEAAIDRDVSCDGLSTNALFVESAAGTQPFEIQFQHVHAGEDPGHEHGLAERETFTLKLGVDNVEGYGARVGFTSRGGFQFMPVQFGPSSEHAHGDGHAHEFGELYLNGAPTGIEFGDLFQSQCSGVERMDGQVFVTFDMLGQDEIYFITIQSNAPFPQRQTFGPFDIPEAVLAEGYGACMISGQSGSGRLMADGVVCLSSAPLDLLPINDDTRTHRDAGRRSR